MKSINNDTLDDVSLYLRFGEGDDSALEELISRWQRGIYSFLFRLCRSSAEAEDLTQEVFIKLVRGAGGYERSNAKFSTFLFRVARNCWLDHVRKAGRRARTVSMDAVRGNPEADLHERLDSGAVSPLNALETEERTVLIREAVEELNDDHRAVFILSAEQGFKYAEIADILSVPEGTVKSRMHTAVQRLQEKLIRRGITQGVAYAVGSQGKDNQ